MSIISLENTVLTGTGDSDKHVLTLYSIAIGMGAKRILELGVRGGSTTLPLLMAAQKTGGMLTSVDIEQTAFVSPVVSFNHAVVVYQTGRTRVLAGSAPRRAV
jgi:predicted O-methyltransferase YrrM